MVNFIRIVTKWQTAFRSLMKNIENLGLRSILSSSTKLVSFI
jgi:hypothetical protein